MTRKEGLEPDTKVYDCFLESINDLDNFRSFRVSSEGMPMTETIIARPNPEWEKYECNRGCDTCRHLQAAVSWWCMCEEAVKHRGTRLPPTRDCKFWKPCRSIKELSWWERWLVYLDCPTYLFME